MLTNADRIVAAITSTPGLSDGELRQRTGIDPHQQVNQICRRLAAEGRTVRRSRPDGVIGNYLADSPPASAAQSTSHRSSHALTRSSAFIARAGALVVLPCSASKRRGASATDAGRAVTEVLHPSTSLTLTRARQRLRAAAGLDETQWMAAWQRYDGTLYSASRRLGAGLAAGQSVVILSGGYGLVFADEPIGWYDHRFSLSDWPKGLLESCLDELVERTDSTSVVSFCARSTGYAELVRRYERGADVPVTHVSPNLEGRGGAMALTPRVSGEALDAFFDGSLSDGWRGSNGVRVDVVKTAHAC